MEALAIKEGDGGGEDVKLLSTKNVKGNRLVVFAEYYTPESVFKIPDGLDLEDKTIVKQWWVKYNTLNIQYVGEEEEVWINPVWDASENDFKWPRECEIRPADDLGGDFYEEEDAEEEEMKVIAGCVVEESMEGAMGAKGGKEEDGGGTKLFETQHKYNLWVNDNLGNLHLLKVGNINDFDIDEYDEALEARGIEWSEWGCLLEPLRFHTQQLVPLVEEEMAIKEESKDATGVDEYESITPKVNNIMEIVREMPDEEFSRFFVAMKNEYQLRKKKTKKEVKNETKLAAAKLAKEAKLSAVKLAKEVREAAKEAAWRKERSLIINTPKPSQQKDGKSAYDKWMKWHTPGYYRGYCGDKYKVEEEKGEEEKEEAGTHK
jgi:hypothetical protein